MGSGGKMNTGDIEDISHLARQIASEVFGDYIGELPTLRDRFAIAAIQAMLTDDRLQLTQIRELGTTKLPAIAYEIADAMLRAREPAPE